LAKNSAICPSRPGSVAAGNDARNRGSGSAKPATRPRSHSHFGGVRASHTSTPAARNSSTYSASATTVTVAVTRKMPQSSQSMPMVFLVSLYALLATIPMTAAPTP
jgi:hypothetical protein